MVERRTSPSDGYIAYNGYPHTNGPDDVCKPDTAQPFPGIDVQREIQPEGVTPPDRHVTPVAIEVTRPQRPTVPARQLTVRDYIRRLLGENDMSSAA